MERGNFQIKCVQKHFTISWFCILQAIKLNIMIGLQLLKSVCRVLIKWTFRIK